MKKVKPILALLLVAVFFIGMIPMSTVPALAATNGHTQSEAVNWASSKVGSVVGGSVECVAFVREYYSYLGYSVHGDGKDYEKNVMDGWTRTYYYSGYIPQPGDIAVWRVTKYKNGTINTYGHVAIVESANSSKMTILEQGSSMGCVKRNSIGYGWYGELTCFIRPNFNTVVDTSAPTISNPYVSNVSGTQFTINCTLSDDVGISRVWLNIYGPSGSDGFSVAASNGSFSYTIQTDKYGGSGWYSVHLYAFDTSEKSTRYAFEGIHATSYANLGDDFYAYIIKYSSWKHLEGSESLNIQIAENGNDSCDPKQIWHFVRQSDNSYKIINEYNGKCMDAFDWGTENGTDVGTCTDNGSSAQKWYLVQSGIGYKIKASYTDLYLDCCDNSDEAGTNIQLYQNHDTPAQIFRIYNLTNDGSNYAKIWPSPVKVTATVNSDRVTVSWTESKLNNEFDKREYDLRVFDSNDNVVYSKLKLAETSHTFKLPQTGTYKVSVASVNSKYWECFNFSEKISFTINKLTPKATVKGVKIEHGASLNYKSSYMLVPEITADDGAKYTVKYESSNTSVATVGKDGKIYGAKKGNATITCTVTDSYGNVVKDSCNVNVEYSAIQWVIIIVLFGWIWYI